MNASIILYFVRNIDIGYLKMILQNIVKEKVIYMSFFNISFRNKNEAGAIGIIGGADGPTCIYTSKDIKNKKDEQEKFLSYLSNQTNN